MVRTSIPGTPPCERSELVETHRYHTLAQMTASAMSPAIVVESPAGYEVWKLTGR